MAILVDSSTRLIVQGITGRDGSFQTAQMVAYGTQVVGGVRPGKGGTKAQDVPVFNTMREAVRETGANTSIIFVPAPGGADAILEAASVLGAEMDPQGGPRLVVCITEHIPVQDMIRVSRFLKDLAGKVRLIGPNCPGLITPGEAKVGIMPGHIFTPGKVGLVSRSGTLTYEVVNTLTELGVGQSTCVGIGGDPIIGTNFVDVLRLFHDDPGTEVIVLIGEIGGSDEEDAARYLAQIPGGHKPVVAFISGRSAPPGKRMGHAGAIISGGSGGPEAKVRAFQEIGVPVADNIPQIGELVSSLVRGAGVRT
jgi:succinyl-CoA synthetase alpha subunit